MKSDLSAAIAALRHERGISQRDAAGELGISQALLSHYEKGVREPRLEFVVKLAEYYGVTTDYLLGASDIRAGAKDEVKQDNRACLEAIEQLERDMYERLEKLKELFGGEIGE